MKNLPTRLLIPLLFFFSLFLKDELTHAQSSAPLPRPQDSPDAATTSPLALKLTHEIHYEPARRKVRVVQARWEMQQLGLGLFEGRAALAGTGRMAGDKLADAATSLTLERVDLQQALRFLKLARAGELEARVSGQVTVEIRQGDWRRLELDLRGEPGTVRISRGLLKMLLAQSALGGKADSLKFDETLNKFYGDQSMIPLEEVSLVGRLGEQSLNLKIPFHNAALKMLLETRIERPVLGQIWAYLKQAGVENWRGLRLPAAPK